MGILDLLPSISAVVQKVLDFIPDPNKRAEAAEAYQRALLDAQTKEAADQRETNKVEATSASVFVAGWRPAIGWVCALALSFQYLLKPLLTWAGGIWWPQLPALPGLDDSLWQLMFGMLGLGGLRTIEKTKGITK